MADTRSPGAHIARIRESHRITRDALAERSGVPLDLLVKIEEGGLTPDLAPLVKIARALGVRLGTFMDDQEDLGPVVSRKGDERPTVRFTGASAGSSSGGAMAYASLAAGKGGRHMEPFIIDIQGSSSAAANVALESSHEGEEFVYVMSGVVEIRYGTDRYTLNEGDSIYYDSIVPHLVLPGSSAGARILAVVYAPF